MNPIRRIRRIAAALAGLACAWLGLAVAAPAAFAAMSVPPPGGGSAGIASQPTPPGSYPCLPGCSALLTKHRVLPPGWTKHPPLPAQAAPAAGHHQSLTGGLPAPLAAHIHQQAPQATGPVPVHTVIVGGMPGWQIALIAAAAALIAATVAVLADRARTARRKSATAAA
jgi:hypothetical protein